MASRGAEDFINLPFQEKLEFLYGLPARQKLDLILSAPEAERLVQSFSPETLFYTLKEIGSADAGDLLSLAIPEQIQGLVDLDCWRKDRPDLDRMREWLESMAEGGRRRLADALVQLDLELVTLLVRQYAKVYRLDEAQAVLDVPSRQMMQFDEHYVIEFIRHDNILPLIQDFIEEVFERDYDYYSSLMEEIYWGVEAELEEEAFKYRRARLNDRGFPDYFDAQDVFAYLDPTRFEEIRRAHSAPAREELLREDEVMSVDQALIAPGADNSLFNTALTAGFAAQGMREVRTEMALVTNQVLVARSIDFGDPEAVTVAVELTHDYLNLALEHLAGGDLQMAIDHLRDTHLKLLFRLGVSLTIDLRKRAEEVMRTLGYSSGRNPEISYLDSPYREALAGFLETLPRFFGGLDRAGSMMKRDFREMRDLHVSYGAINRIEAMRSLFQRLFDVDIAKPGFRVQMAGREIRLSQILLTALVNHALHGRLTMEPLVAGDLRQIRERLTTTDEVAAGLSESFRSDIEEVLSSRLDEELRMRSSDFLESCLNLLEDEFSNLPRGTDVDPRFIGTVLVRRPSPV